jgi:pimeloyl-ACP methyl ester carboxylesterase
MVLSAEQFRDINDLSADTVKQCLRDGSQRDSLVEYLGGEDQYEFLRALVNQAPVIRSQIGQNFAGVGAEIILLPGIMGSELKDETYGKVWVDYVGLAVWKTLAKLALDTKGEKDKDTVACFKPVGLFKPTYLPLQTWLEQKGHTVYPFAYDWRKSVDISAVELQKFVEEKSGGNPDKQFIFIAHSMGGLVARRYLDLDSSEVAEKRLRKLIMLGTPNHGSYMPMQVVKNKGDMVLKIAGLRYGSEVFKGVIHSFLGLYEMLPNPYLKDSTHVENVYKATYWDEDLISQQHLSAAQQFHQDLKACLPHKMILIANNSIKTAKSVDRRIDGDCVRFVFGVGWGDGTVAMDSAYLEDVPTYLTKSSHSKIPSDPTTGD